MLVIIVNCAIIAIIIDHFYGFERKNFRGCSLFQQHAPQIHLVSYKIQYQRLVYKYYDFEKQKFFMCSVFYGSTKRSWVEMNAHSKIVQE